MAEGTTTLKTLHPLAWWCWAIGLGLAVNGTTNPILLALIALAVIAVVLLRRSTAPWAKSVRAYLVLGGFVIGARVFFQIVIGAKTGQTVLFTLPEIPLPDWAAGIRLGGPVTAEALAYTVNDALRLAVMLLCVGSANALANPRQALRSMPAALYEASVSIVIALSVAPQLIESGIRVRRARRLRGDPGKGLRALASLIVPVLAEAIERSLSLAAGMEARGFARTRGLPARGSLAMMLAATSLATFGVFLLLGSGYREVGLAALAAGVGGSAVGLRLAGRRLAVTHYRPHPWGRRETAVALCGLLPAVLVLGIGTLDPDHLTAAWLTLLNPQAFFPSTDPLAWPALTAPMLVTAILAATPLLLTRPQRAAGVDPARTDVRLRSLRPSRAEELVRL